MALPCCELTYQKYIEPDGRIDVVAHERALEERRQLLEEDGRQPPITPQRICTCFCHIKGLNVIH
jgi:hypothetical protein